VNSERGEVGGESRAAGDEEVSRWSRCVLSRAPPSLIVVRSVGIADLLLGILEGVAPLLALVTFDVRAARTARDTTGQDEREQRQAQRRRDGEEGLRLDEMAQAGEEELLGNIGKHAYGRLGGNSWEACIWTAVREACVGGCILPQFGCLIGRLPNRSVA
jgi:hypothetical protein